jgi:GTP cyclohydrolase II
MLKAGYEAEMEGVIVRSPILSDLKVGSIVLLANGAGKANDLRKESITITETRQFNSYALA